MKYFLIGLLLHLLAGMATKLDAQRKALRPGDLLPNGAAAYISRTTKIPVSDLKNKLVVLDFFATWCSPCVKALSELQGLQDRFAGKVYFVVISNERAEQIRGFISIKKKAARLTLPFISADTALHRLFPHQSIPHEVWIKDGKVIAVTGSEDVTEAHLQSILNGKQVSLKEKRDDVIVDTARALVSHSADSTIGNTGYSGFTGMIAGIPGMREIISGDSGTGIDRYRLFNWPLSILYAVANEKGYVFTTYKRCVLQVRDTSDYFYDALADGEYGKWQERHWFSYELTTRSGYDRKIFHKRLLADLDFFFHLRSSIEKRKIKCWILRKKAGAALNNTKGGFNEARMNIDRGTFVYHQSNEFVFMLANLLNNDRRFAQVPLVIDETASGKMDMQFTLENPFRIESWQKALSVYDIELVEEERDIEMLVLREPKNL